MITASNDEQKLANFFSFNDLRYRSLVMILVIVENIAHDRFVRFGLGNSVFFNKLKHFLHIGEFSFI